MGTAATKALVTVVVVDHTSSPCSRCSRCSAPQLAVPGACLAACEPAWRMARCKAKAVHDTLGIHVIDAAWPLVAASIAYCGLERIRWVYIYCYRKLRENVHLDKKPYSCTGNKKQTRRHLGVPGFFFNFWFPVNFADKNSDNGTRVRLALILGIVGQPGP